MRIWFIIMQFRTGQCTLVLFPKSVSPLYTFKVPLLYFWTNIIYFILYRISGLFMHIFMIIIFLEFLQTSFDIFKYVTVSQISYISSTHKALLFSKLTKPLRRVPHERPRVTVKYLPHLLDQSPSVYHEYPFINIYMKW